MTQFPIPPLPRVENRNGDRMVMPPRLARSWEEGMRQRGLVQQDSTPRPAPKLDRETQRLAEVSTNAPRVPWDVFIRDHFHWLPGEHMGMIGPTGQGKTTMLFNVLPFKDYVVVFATKPRDENMKQLIRSGYLHLKRWMSLDPDQYPRRVLWPDASKLGAAKEQQSVFHDAFERIYLEQGWTVALDETWYVNNVLKLSMDIRTYLLQARSLGISLICATQRPSAVPLEIYDQSTHLFFWRDNDKTNLDRISGIASHSEAAIRRIVANLETFQVLYINVRTGAMFRTRCPRIELLEGR